MSIDFTSSNVPELDDTVKKVQNKLKFTQNNKRAIIKHLHRASEWGFHLDISFLKLLVKSYLKEQGVDKFPANFLNRQRLTYFVKKTSRNLSPLIIEQILRGQISRSACSELSEYFLLLNEIRTLESLERLGTKFASPKMEVENNLSDVETLESPLKSLKDEKEYRVIELKNGLRALLISDLANLKKENVNRGRTLSDKEQNGEHKESCMDLDDEDEDEEEEEGEDEEEEEEEEGEEEEGEEEEEEDTSKATEEERTEKRKRKRKTRYLSAASLCIGVGSFEDPLEIQGLMHFLEHMVFMGSEKYPLENCFDNHIKKWGGNDNAHTDYERTNFYFDVQEMHFEKALDMFAQFFISPLMKVEAMQRERKAVHSEFQGALDDDDCRRQQVFCLFANEDHPMSYFTFGNETTLQLEIPDEELHSKLHRLRSQFYSAQYMTLAIQARESLDKLQEMVTQIFSKVPNNGLPKPSYEKFGFPFPEERFHKFVKVIPINDRHTLDINWVLPSLLKNYQCKPLHYIAFLIGHEGFGSIISYLKKRVWAVDIYAGNDESGFEHNTTYALFNVRLRLTDEGFGHLREITNVVFQYIRRLQMEGPSERIYSEIQKMEKIDFDYAEEKSTSENVQDLSEEMQLYPPNHYLSGGSLLFQYDPDIITECLNVLQPTCCNIMVSSKKYEHENIAFESEKWFGTKYSIEDIPAQWIEEWQTSEISQSLHLPSPNDFIPEDFSILTSNRATFTKHPRNLEKNREGELWYKQDNKFGLPRAYCYIYFSLKYIGESAEMGAMLDLFLNLFLQHIMEPLYPARMAEYETVLKAADLGFFMRVSGFNDKLYKCLQMILSQLNDFENCLDDKTFEEMKQQQLKSYYNAILCPDSLRRDSRLVLLQEIHWQVSEKMKALQNVSKEYFLDKFLNRMLSHKYIKMLVQGNIRAEDAKMMFKSVVDFKRPMEATKPNDVELDSTEETDQNYEAGTEKEPCPEVLVIGNNWVKRLSKYYDSKLASVDFVFGPNWDLNKIINRLPEVIRPSHSYLVVFGLLLEGFEEVEFGPKHKVMRPRQSFSPTETLRKIEELVKVARSFNPNIVIYIELPPVVSLSWYNVNVLRSAPLAIQEQYAADRQYFAKVLWDESLKRYNEMCNLRSPLSQLRIKVLSVMAIPAFTAQSKKVLNFAPSSKPSYLLDGVYPTNECAKKVMGQLFTFMRRYQRQKMTGKENPSLNNGEPSSPSALNQVGSKKKKKRKRNKNKNKREKENSFSSVKVDPHCSFEPTSNVSTAFFPSPQQMEPEIDRVVTFIRGIASGSGSHDMTEAGARQTLLNYLINRP